MTAIADTELTRLGQRVAPLSFAQERLWYIDAADPGAPTYNVPLFIQWTERVDVDALAEALEAVTARHEILRTTYALRDGRPLQVVETVRPVPIAIRDASDLSRNHVRAEARRLAREGFDLAGEPPLRCVLWQHLPGGDAVLLNLHHIAVDGWSLAPLFEDLAAAYEAALDGRAPALPELPVQYADFATWDRAAGETPAARRALDRRLEQLLAVPGGLELATARPRATAAAHGAEHAFAVPAELVTSTEGLAASLRCTPFVLLLAAFQAVLARWTGRDEFLVGTVAADRPHPAAEPLVGFFVNTVPLRCAPRPELNFSELCLQVRDEAFAALTHQRIPYAQLVAGGRRGNVIDVGFVLQNMPVPKIDSPRWEPPALLSTGTAKFDLCVILDPVPDGLAGRIEFAADRYSEATAAELAHNLLTLLAAAVRDPERALRELPISSAATGVIAGERREVGPATTIIDAIAAPAAGATAVTCRGHATSWAELDRHAWAVAGELAGRGIGRGDLVPVIAARGGPLVAAWLGTLRAGAAFVPLSLDTPPDRLAHIVEHVGAAAVLVDADGAEVAGGLAVTQVSIEPLAAASAVPFDAALRGDDPAVVIYTSGTTGRPKGVVVPHRGLLNTALWWADDVGLGPQDRLLCTWSTSFDGATFDTFRSLAAGATLVFADDVERRDPAALLRLMRGPQGATVTAMTPSLLRALLDADTQAHAVSLRVLDVGGEALPRALADRCVARWGVPLRNIYGPTEASCISTFAPVELDDPRPPAIGTPLPNTRAYVLGPHCEQLPAGVPGELYVAGRGVALGYLGAPELTAAAFLPDPYATGRMYRTGDRVTKRADGQIEYLGRADDQVKVLGHRIELGEVSALLAEHPAVRAAAVLASDEPKRLIGFAVLEAGEDPPTRADVVAPLLRWLPPAVLPAEVYAVDALPMTGNDKVDAAALAEMRERPLPDAPAAPPRPLTTHERQAAELFAEALGSRPVSPDANFFTLGGHSLLSVKMLAPVGVPLRDFLADPTIAGLGRLLASPARTPDTEPPDGYGPYPATSVQRRLWFMDRVASLRTAYLVPTVIELDGPVDRERLRQSLAGVLARHPALRSRFELDRSERRVVYRTDGPPPVVTLTDARGWTPGERDAHVTRVCWAPFDLAHDALARAELLALDDERTLLVLSAHHIVMDGWSQQLLLDELAASYADPHTAPAAPVHPSQLTRQPLEPEAIIKALSGAPTDVALPRARPRPAVQQTAAATATASLDAVLTARLRVTAADAGCTTFMIAAALLAVSLAERSAQRDFLFAFPWAGRDTAASAAAVGMFVNTLVLRVDLRGGPTWAEVLDRVRAASLEAYSNADAPFDAVAAALHPGRDLSRPAITPVYVTAQDAPARAPDLGEHVRARFAPLPELHVKHELELTAADGGEQLELTATYATEALDAETVNSLLAGLEAVARELVAHPRGPALRETA